jgi:dTDP-L-rhamnose 4-epimerase
MTAEYCLVTGGAGFIGCAVSAALIERYGRLIVMDNLHPQVHPKHERPPALDARAELHVEDVTSNEAWERVLASETASPTAVVHLAAETGTSQSLTEASRHSLVNVVGTTRMLDTFSRRGWIPRHFVLSGTRAVYGEGSWRRSDGSIFQPGQRSTAQLARGEWDFPSATPLQHDARRVPSVPVSVYGATKVAQEYLLQVWAQAFGVRCTILRFQNVYGPGQSLWNPYTGILPFFARLSREGQSIPLFEDGQMMRDFVYVDDVADSIICALSAPVCKENVGKLTLDIGSGGTTTIADVAAIIARYYGAPAPHLNGNYRLGDVRHAHCVIDHAADAIGWAPRKPLEVGLGALLDWTDAKLQISEQNVSYES